MGMSMKLKKSTVEDVKARFEFLKEKKKQEKKEYSLSERLEDAKEEEEKMQAYTQQVSKKIFYKLKFLIASEMLIIEN